MTTPCSGEIGISHINTELQTVGSARTLGQTDGRSLCGVASGSIALSDYYCRSSAMNAIGGVISTYVDGNGYTWKVHTFWSTANFQVISLGGDPTVEYMLISGGGSGGHPVGSPPRGASGGGGGGTYFSGAFDVSVGVYIAGVGVGGSYGASGGSSSLFGSSIPGGGAGGRYPAQAGFAGSSGGGGGQGGSNFSNSNLAYIYGGAALYNGNAGGTSIMGRAISNAGGGGGGGIAGVGGNSRGVSYAKGTAYSAGGHGANGVVVTFAGSLHPVGAGGGGAGANPTHNTYWADNWPGTSPGGPPGEGGVCPNGGTNYLSGGRGANYNVQDNAAGIDGTGGGGGGGSFGAFGQKGGNGKIVIRYRIS